MAELVDVFVRGEVMWTMSVEGIMRQWTVDASGAPVEQVPRPIEQVRRT